MKRSITSTDNRGRKTRLLSLNISALTKCSKTEICSLLKSTFFWNGQCFTGLALEVITPFNLDGFHVYCALLSDHAHLINVLEQAAERSEQNTTVQIPVLAKLLANKLQKFKQFYIFWDDTTTNEALSKQFPNEWIHKPEITGECLKSLIDINSHIIFEQFTKDLGIPAELCERIVTWIHSIDTIKVPYVDPVQSVISEFATGNPHTLTSPLIHMPFKTNDQIISKISNCFKKLLKAREKGSINFPFLACSPGTGKSRTLQEIFPYTDQGKELKNSTQIHISFGNGTPINHKNPEKLTPTAELVSRIIFSYYKIDTSFLHFQKTFEKTNFTLYEVLQGVYEDFISMTNTTTNGDDLYIYLAIDEFTELLYLNGKDVDSTNNEVERSYLEFVIRELGSYIINSNNSLTSKVHILPLFAGLDYNIFKHSVSESTYECEYINPYIFNIADVSNLINLYLPSLRYSSCLWKVIGLLGSNNRFLEHLIFSLKDKKVLTTTEIKMAYEVIEKNFSEKPKIDLSIQSGKKLIATVILGEEVQLLGEFDRIKEKKFTWKQLEDSGLVRLVKNSECYHVIASLGCLKYCSSILQNKIFTNFLDLLFASIFQPMTHDRPFETFNGTFDIVRNFCLLFLGKKTMPLTERFLGIDIGDTQLTDIDVENYPTELTLQEPSHLNDCSKMIQNRTINSCFFDRFSKCSGTNISFILWQDRGFATDLTNFTQVEMDELFAKHFTDTKLEKLGAKKENSLAIVITNRPASAKLTLPNGFAILDRKGLVKYYGPFVSSIFLYTILLPFPLFQTKKYSALDLAMFLGVEKRRAERLRTQIANNKESASKIIAELELDPALIENDTSAATDPYIYAVPTDGNCLFSSCIIGKNLLSRVQYSVSELREQVAKYMLTNTEKEMIVAQMVEIITSKEFYGLGDLAPILESISHQGELLGELLEELVPNYIENMKKNGVWGGNVELSIIAKLLNMNIIVKGDVCVKIEGSTDENQTITLILKNNHYQLRIDNRFK